MPDGRRFFSVSTGPHLLAVREVALSRPVTASAFGSRQPQRPMGGDRHLAERRLPCGSGVGPRSTILNPLHAALPHIGGDVLDHRILIVARVGPAPSRHI